MAITRLERTGLGHSEGHGKWPNSGCTLEGSPQSCRENRQGCRMCSISPFGDNSAFTEGTLWLMWPLSADHVSEQPQMCPPFWKAALALFVTIHFCLFARESISVCVALHWISVVQLCLVSSDLSSYRSELVHLVLFSQRMNMAFEYNLHVSNAQSLCEQLTGCLH